MADRKPFLRVTEVDGELARLLEETRHREVTEEEYREQRISFAYGNSMDDSITKESVRQRASCFRLRSRKTDRN